LYVAEMINIESFVILLDISNCSKFWDQSIGKKDVIWEQASRQYLKYRPFLPYDKERFIQILKSHFNPWQLGKTIVWWLSI